MINRTYTSCWERHVLDTLRSSYYPSAPFLPETDFEFLAPNIPSRKASGLAEIILWIELLAAHIIFTEAPGTVIIIRDRSISTASLVSKDTTISRLLGMQIWCAKESKGVAYVPQFPQRCVTLNVNIFPFG